MRRAPQARRLDEMLAVPPVLKQLKSMPKLKTKAVLKENVVL